MFPNRSHLKNDVTLHPLFKMMLITLLRRYVEDLHLNAHIRQAEKESGWMKNPQVGLSTQVCSSTGFQWCLMEQQTLWDPVCTHMRDTIESCMCHLHMGDFWARSVVSGYINLLQLQFLILHEADITTHLVFLLLIVIKYFLSHHFWVHGSHLLFLL